MWIFLRLVKRESSGQNSDILNAQFYVTYMSAFCMNTQRLLKHTEHELFAK